MLGTGTVLKTETIPIQTANDISLVRQRVRNWAVEQGFSIVEQTKIVTAASELARNTLDHGRGGEVELAILEGEARMGLRLCFRDKGPGIPDIALAMRDGYTSAKGMGLGLGGSKRLMHEFSIQSAPGVGTTITVARWK